MINKLLESFFFGCAWIAWVFNVIALNSYNWITQDSGDVNGPNTFGIFNQRLTCRECSPLPSSPPRSATAAFMILSNLATFTGVCISVIIIARNGIAQKLSGKIRIFTICFMVLMIVSALFTLIAASVYQSLGINDRPSTTRSEPLGYGLVLAWCSFVLQLISTIAFVPYYIRVL